MLSQVEAHCRELERCNQRGGRMLSLLDLLDAGTLDLDLAAHLMAHFSRGVSFMVGARPGGAGKTTVMCACANLWPADVGLAAATPEAVRSALQSRPAAGVRGYICHEIGPGPYFAYLWGKDLRAYFELAERGHLLAANLHADTLEEARTQVCAQNGVPERHFNAFRLLVFLGISRGFSIRRQITKVYLSDGNLPHQCVFEYKTGILRSWTDRIDGAWLSACREFLDGAFRAKVRTIQDTRHRLVMFLADQRDQTCTSE